MNHPIHPQQPIHSLRSLAPVSLFLPRFRDFLPKSLKTPSQQSVFYPSSLWCFDSSRDLPSGELTFCHGKSPFLMGKSTISMAIFNCYVSSPEIYCTSKFPRTALCSRCCFSGLFGQSCLLFEEDPPASKVAWVGIDTPKMAGFS